MQKLDTAQSMRTVQSVRHRPVNSGPYFDDQTQRQFLPPLGDYYNNQTSGQAVKRQASCSAKSSGPKQQRINNISHEITLIESEHYEYQANLAASEIDGEEEFDQIVAGRNI